MSGGHNAFHPAISPPCLSLLLSLQLLTAGLLLPLQLLLLLLLALTLPLLSVSTAGLVLQHMPDSELSPILHLHLAKPPASPAAGRQLLQRISDHMLKVCGEGWGPGLGGLRPTSVYRGAGAAGKSVWRCPVCLCVCCGLCPEH